MKKLTLKIDDSPETKQRKRMCLNCRHRAIEEASDFCMYDGKRYMHYDKVFEGWCPHWSKRKR